jgi:hypothetical protein
MNELVLNSKARHHIKLFPLDNIEVPKTEREQLLWAESVFKALERSHDAKRLFLYKSKKQGYMISVWAHNDLYFLIQCIRNEFKTFNDTLYIGKTKDDMISIAKFLQDNVETIMSDYKSQILEARNWMLKNNVHIKND